MSAFTHSSSSANALTTWLFLHDDPFNGPGYVEDNLFQRFSESFFWETPNSVCLNSEYGNSGPITNSISPQQFLVSLPPSYCHCGHFTHCTGRAHLVLIASRDGCLATSIRCCPSLLFRDQTGTMGFIMVVRLSLWPRARHTLKPWWYWAFALPHLLS